MATDLEERQVTPDADANDPYNREFEALTSPDHYGQDGVEGDTGGGSSGTSSAGDSTSGSTGDNGKSVSPTGLNGMETGAAGASTATDAASAIGGTAAGAAEAASLFTGGGAAVASNIFSRLGITKKKGIGGGVGLVVAGSVFFGLSVASGPFQFIHFAQLLQQFHLNEQSDESDDRLSKLTRFARFAKTGNIEETRLGVFANHYASTIETGLNKSGITSTYDKYGRFQGYEINNTDEKFGKTDDDVKQYFKENYGVDVSAAGADGKLTINTEKNGYFAQRKLIGSMLEEAGYKGISGAIQARIMGKRAGITWHPITQLDNKVKSKAADIIESAKEKFSSDAANGAPAEPVATDTTTNPEDTSDPAKTQQDSSAAAKTSGDTNGAIKDIEAADAGGGSGALKIAGGAAALVGVACVLSSLDKDASKIKEAQVVMPIMRMGMEVVSLGNQAMYGGQDNSTYLQQLGGVSQYLNSDKGSWTEAQSVQAELGQKEDGTPPDGTLTTITKGSALDFVNDEPLSSAISVGCSTAGQFILTGLSFITGPISTVAGLALSTVLTQTGVLHTVASWLSGKAVNIASLSPPQFGNYVNYGVKMAANDRAVSAGGVALTSAQVATLDGQQQSEADSAFQSQSFADRIFDPYDSQSVVGSLLDAQNTNVSSNFTQVASSFLRIGGSLLSIPSKLFGSKASAAPDTSYNYGFPTYGFSAQELADPNLDNPYDNADYVIANLLPNNDVISAANSCFGVQLNADGTQVQAAGSSITDVYNASGDNSYNSGACADGSKAGVSKEDWLRVRMFIFDSETADSMSCYEGDPTSCNDVGFGADATSTPTGSSTTVNDTSAPSYCHDGSATGNEKIICSAFLFDNYDYLYDGRKGSDPSVATFMTNIKTCVADNYATGCKYPQWTPLVDCSGLVDDAIYDALGIDLGGAGTRDYPGNPHLQPIALNQAQPGDIAWWDSPDGHTEVIISYNATSNSIDTVGAHQSGVADEKQIGPDSYPAGSFPLPQKVFRVVP